MSDRKNTPGAMTSSNRKNQAMARTCKRAGRKRLRDQNAVSKIAGRAKVQRKARLRAPQDSTGGAA